MRMPCVEAENRGFDLPLTSARWDKDNSSLPHSPGCLDLPLDFFFFNGPVQYCNFELFHLI